MERSASIYGSSSALRGVQLKIGETFKPPAKVTLPVGFKIRDPSQIFNLTVYDFSLEEDVIAKSTAERLAKEQHQNVQKAKEQANQLTSTKPITATMGADMLQPTTVISPSSTRKEDKETFNYKDFEGDGDTPFELVELQCINNMDALKSVLQPELNSNLTTGPTVTSADNIQGNQVTNTNANIPNGHTNDAQVKGNTSNATGNAMNKNEIPSQIPYSTQNVAPSVSSNSPPLFFPTNPTQSVPVANLGLNATNNPFAPQNCGPVAMVDNTIPAQHPVSGINIPATQHQNAFNTSSSKTALPTKAPLPGAMRVLPGPPPSKPLPRKPENISSDTSNVVDDVVADGASSGTNQKRPIPKPRTKLPPIKSNPVTPEVPPPLPPKKSKMKTNNQNVHTFGLKDEQPLTHYTPLPPISPPPPPAGPTSTIPDLSSTMSPDEIKFVKELSAMGFPAPRVARAVKHFGCKEREVVEFLIVVNEMCSTGFSETQVEMVVKETDSNKEKAEKYLSLIAQFKQLGFQEEKIFNALKKTECDSDKTLDILTCAS